MDKKEKPTPAGASWIWPVMIVTLIGSFLFLGGANNYATENSLPTASKPELYPESVGTPTSGQEDHVLINDVLDVKATSSAQEFISIRAGAQNKKPINISGLSYKARSGYKYSIPEGIDLYLPGTTQKAKDIELLPGEYAYVHTGRSPLGVSFKENICSHLMHPMVVYPKPEFPHTLRYEGTNYIDCVHNMKGSPEFWRPIWHVYLGATAEIWGNEHDVIRFVDRLGQSIQTIQY